VDLDWI